MSGRRGACDNGLDGVWKLLCAGMVRDPNLQTQISTDQMSLPWFLQEVT